MSKQYFEEVAPQWDEMRKTFFSEAVRNKAFCLADIQSNKIAADIGAGTGFITEGLIQKGVHVIAVDQSVEMLGVIKEKFSQKEIDCRVGEAEKLPMNDESVDYVFANMYLHHVEFPERAIQEMVRILKPGGKVVITDLDEHTFEFLKEEHHDRWMGFKRIDIENWFKKAGLKKVIIDDVGEDCCSKSSCGTTKANIKIFASTGQK